jgi:hypothetical protein
MAEREGTPEDFARMLRSGRKQEANKAIVEALHPPSEPQEPEPESGPDVTEPDLIAALTKPKPWARALVDQLHPPKEEG